MTATYALCRLIPEPLQTPDPVSRKLEEHDFPPDPMGSADAGGGVPDLSSIRALGGEMEVYGFRVKGLRVKVLGYVALEYRVLGCRI